MASVDGNPSIRKRIYEGDLPQEVIDCLKSSRFLHLATCTALWPSLALMNYTYMPPSKVYPPGEKSSGPGIIIMLLSASTKKYSNILANPRVSLLVHDWVSPRHIDTSSPSTEASIPILSSLAQLLQNLNSAALKANSHTIRGYARLIAPSTAEESYYKQAHIENNKYEDSMCYIQGDDGSKVVIVEIEGGKVADWKGEVSEWGYKEEETEAVNGLVNGM